MTTALFSTSETVLRAITVLASGYVVLSSAEYLAARDRLQDDDILSWKVSKQRPVFSYPFVSHVSDAIFPYPRFLGLLASRLLLGAFAGILALSGTQSPILLAGIVATTFAISFRHPYGLEGGFQMSFIVFSALFIASLFPEGSIERDLAILFIAAQAILSYLVAGVSKASSDIWRDGGALTGIFGTSIYGHQWVYERLQDYPQLGTVGCWATIAFECLFPSVLLAPSEYVFAFLLLGFSFHVGAAIFMGLNGFILPFVATYPAIIYANRFVGVLS
ncbi:hypothetical protein [Natrinema salaciae]|uniref:HTTM domain-containing protein n=1 Tax=Natrinema salaciae TaxID=1186196 RepID=A0A1H9RIM2_9EURY|nr:hypothetical protein [Natrinema salaciae]SER72385.1 hypothetical protein SAMN04489841_4411 [Natrinema salaciae]